MKSDNKGGGKMPFFEKLKSGLKKTRENFFGKIANLLSRKKLDEETLEELEELFISADIGVETAVKLIEMLRKEKPEDPLKFVEEKILEILSLNTAIKFPEDSPAVISVVGVNGSGKTTTCAKLAKIFVDDGKSVVLAAADTFRAAAIEQLKHWGEKIGATVISHQEGSDPAAVAFDAVRHAKARGKDVVIIDTAGRLHNKRNLMEELRKIHRVVGKEVNGAPHEVLLVLDATTGQNGLVQAKIFKEIVDITGIVVTKLDGTAKGGIVITIADELKIPIKFIGVGEKEDDLKEFEAKDFVKALFE
jgi:fused signal recognition particle receptor